MLENGDTKKQLLACSRTSCSTQMINGQKNRATILFELYPDIKQAYFLTHSLRMIFSNNTDKGLAYTKMAKWENVK